MGSWLGNLAAGVTVGRPSWLILLPITLIPLVLLSYRSLSGLGPVRRWVAIAARSSVVAAIVLALAEVQAVQRNEKLTTLYVVDASESIPLEYRSPILQFVSEDTKKRVIAKNDQTGVVVFG